MSDEYYIEISGKVRGPVVLSEMRKLTQRGKISRQTRIRQGANGQWVLAGTVNVLFPSSDENTLDAPTQPPLPADLAPAEVRETSITESQSGRSIQSIVGLRRKPIVEWAFYASGLGILMAFILGRFIVTALQSDATGICILIFALFIVAAIKNLLDILFIQKQMDLADEQVAILKQTNDIVAFVKSSEPSLLRDHIQNLYAISRRDTTVRQDNLIALLQTRLLARTKLTDFVSSILVTLGLVGTIVGLIASAGGLGTVMDAVGSDSEALLSGMRQTVGGMGTAFYTTLMGAILGGVGLRLLSNIVDSNIDHVVAHIAELTEIYIVPSLRRAAKDRFERKRREKRRQTQHARDAIR